MNLSIQNYESLKKEYKQAFFERNITFLRMKNGSYQCKTNTDGIFCPLTSIQGHSYTVNQVLSI